MKTTIKFALIAILAIFSLNIVLAAQADNIIIYKSIADPTSRQNNPELVYITFFNNGTTAVNLTSVLNNWTIQQVNNTQYSYIGNDKTGYTNVLTNTTLSGNNFVNLTLRSGLTIEPKNFVTFYYSYQRKQVGNDANTTLNITAKFSDSSTSTRIMPMSVKNAALIEIYFNVDSGLSGFFEAVGANDTMLPGQQRTFTFNISERANNQYYSGGNATFTFPSGFTNVQGSSNGSVTSKCIGNVCNCTLPQFKGSSKTCVVYATMPANPTRSDYVIIGKMNGVDANSNIMNTTAELLVRLPGAFNYDSNMRLLESITSPAPSTSPISSDVYFIIWNNGTSPKYVSELVQDWGYIQVQSISSSVIGNDKTGYSSISSSIIGNRFIVWNAPNILVEPNSYVEVQYNYAPLDGSDTGTLNNVIAAFFNDSTFVSRANVIQRYFDAPKIDTAFTINGSSYTKTGAGANESLLNRSANASMTAVITEYTSAHPFTGNVTIYFPTGFTNITPVAGGDVTPVCGTNYCRCAVSSLLHASKTCKISFVVPDVSSTTDYIIYANASSSSTSYNSNMVVTSSEWLIRVPPTVAKPQIINCSVDPRDFELPNNTYISAVVIPAGSVTVYANVTGPSPEIVSLAQHGNNYSEYYTPALDGDYNVTIFASRGNNIVNLSCGSLVARQPVFPPPIVQCQGVYSLGIAAQPSILDYNKTKAFLDMSYYCARNLLGLWSYDFYFEVKYLNGSFVKVDDTNVQYGKYPPPDAQIFVLNRPSLFRTGATYDQVMVTIGVWV